jgi:hypothetical protein
MFFMWRMSLSVRPAARTILIMSSGVRGSPSAPDILAFHKSLKPLFGGGGLLVGFRCEPLRLRALPLKVGAQAPLVLSVVGHRGSSIDTAEDLGLASVSMRCGSKAQ